MAVISKLINILKPVAEDKAALYASTMREGCHDGFWPMFNAKASLKGGCVKHSATHDNVVTTNIPFAEARAISLAHCVGVYDWQ
jgi:hypothetical protein